MPKNVESIHAKKNSRTECDGTKAMLGAWRNRTADHLHPKKVSYH